MKKSRSGWRQFLTPGWVITAVLVIAFAYTAFTVLAPWQLGKNTRTQATNHRLEKAFDADPVPLASILTAGDSTADGAEGAEGAAPTIPEDKEWTRVTAQGEFLPQSELLLRNRPVDTHPAYQILTPFKTSDGTIIIVNRGYVYPETGKEVPDYDAPPAGTVTISGFARLDEPAPDEMKTVEAGGKRQITNISSQWFHAENPDMNFVSGYVQLDKDQPGVLTAIPLPQLSSGPYLSYGIQWIAFGILAPLGLAYFVYAEIRERRRAAREDEEFDSVLDASDNPKDAPAPGDESAGSGGVVGAGSVAVESSGAEAAGQAGRTPAGADGTTVHSGSNADQPGRSPASAEAPADAAGTETANQPGRSPASADGATTHPADNADQDKRSPAGADGTTVHSGDTTDQQKRSPASAAPKPARTTNTYAERYAGTRSKHNAFRKRMEKDEERF